MESPHVKPPPDWFKSIRPTIHHRYITNNLPGLSNLLCRGFLWQLQCGIVGHGQPRKARKIRPKIDAFEGSSCWVRDTLRLHVQDVKDCRLSDLGILSPRLYSHFIFVVYFFFFFLVYKMSSANILRLVDLHPNVRATKTPWATTLITECTELAGNCGGKLLKHLVTLYENHWRLEPKLRPKIDAEAFAASASANTFG